MVEKTTTSFFHSKSFKYQPYNAPAHKRWAITEQHGRVPMNTSSESEVRADQFFALLSYVRFLISGSTLTINTYVISFSKLWESISCKWTQNKIFVTDLCLSFVHTLRTYMSVKHPSLRIYMNFLFWDISKVLI